MKRPSLPVAGAVGAAAAIALVIGQASASAGSGIAINPNTDGAVSSSGVDTSSAIVVLKGDPLTTAPGTRNAYGRVDYSKTATKSVQARLAAERNDFRAWLHDNAPDVVVTGQHDLALNAVTVKLKGTPLDTLLGAPQVAAAQYELYYHPLGGAVTGAAVTSAAQTDLSVGQDVDLALIHAKEAWQQAPTKGAGVKVAVIDTGIDISHPCFSDAGYPAQTQLGDKRFTNNKVIVAKVFNNKTPSMNYTPEALQEHGTHVAGTIACNEDTAATVDGVSIPYGISGVAPQALLGNYNIFPGGVLNARSEDILNALEAAYADGMDVANMSIGGDAHGIQDLDTIAVDNLDAADMVVAVAAGNSGPGAYTDESPGSAQNALTAGASTVPHYVGAPVTVGSDSFVAASGDFATVSSDLTAPLGVLAGSTNGLDTACSAISADLSGKIAVLSRGVCSFSTKIRNAQNAGAIATLVVNNVAGTPIAMGTDGTANQPTIPAYMLPVNAASFFASHDGASATIGTAMTYTVVPGAENIMAGFSSQGPVDVSNRIKPDAVAPGVNVLSSIPHQFCDTPPCFAFFQGTSMATPHLAGSAALLRGAHPDWTAAQVRSAIVNTADRYSLRTSSATHHVIDSAFGVQSQGAGLDDLLAAVDASAALAPVSASFDAIPAGSGQSRTFTMTVTNLTGTAQTWTTGIGDIRTSGVTFAVSPASVSLGAGESATLTITASADKGAPTGFDSAYLTLSSGSNEVAHATLFTLIK